ncbi:MAG: hypothetical protein ABI472_10035 [Ginsengibacter sp.]
MRYEFTQNHIEELHFGNLTPEQLISVAIETSKSLGWILSNVNEKGFVAYTNNGLFSWNAEVRFKIKNESAHLLSQSRGNEAIELEKDRVNLQGFIVTLNDLKKKLTPVCLTSTYKNLQPEFA